MHRALISALIMAALALPAGAREVPRIKVLSSGIYEAKFIKVVRKQRTELSLVGRPRLLKSTLKVPAKRGVYFGLTWLVVHVPQGETAKLEVEIQTPGLRRPDGSLVRFWRYPKVVARGETRFDGVWLRQKWHLVPGRWTIRIISSGRTLARRVFEVQAP